MSSARVCAVSYTHLDVYKRQHFYLRITVTMDKAMEARKAINDVSPVKVSFNDLIIKACAMALRQHPDVNSSWMGDFIRHNQHIHVGTAAVSYTHLDVYKRQALIVSPIFTPQSAISTSLPVLFMYGNVS